MLRDLSSYTVNENVFFYFANPILNLHSIKDLESINFTKKLRKGIT